MSKDDLSSKITIVQYRCLVGYLSHWYPTIPVAQALEDLKINMTEQEAIWEVEKCGYSFDYKLGLSYDAEY